MKEWIEPSVANAENTDLTSTLFNPDGSLKEGVDNVAKFQSIEFSCKQDGSSVAFVDGSSLATTQSQQQSINAIESKKTIKLRYDLPSKWTTNSGNSGVDLYVDRSEGFNDKACNHITVYRPSGSLTIDRLEKASSIGIAKVLNLPSELNVALEQADLISARTVTKKTNDSSETNGQRYFEFDMAVAPKTCGDSAENLGLGFCPYDSIYLLSATVRNEQPYVIALECDKNEWKRANADLRKVRSSFVVTEGA